MLRFSIGEDSGFSLIEVLVSAFLVLTVAGGTLAGLGTFSKASGSERQRTQAAALIQQAQEDLRTLSPSTLAGYVASPPPDTQVAYNGVTYTTHTTAAWVDESSSAAACTGSSTGNRYVRVTTTVSWPGPGGTTRSSTNRTLASVPASGGRLIVQVFDANKNPRSNARVDITGPVTDNATTGTGGCAEWDYLPGGVYTVTLSSATNDFVDKTGNTAPSQTATVVAGKLNIVSFDYDQGGRIQADFWESTNTANPTPSGAIVWANALSCATQTPSCGMDQITVSNGSMPSPKTFGALGTPVPTITTGLLFPFPSTNPYTVIAGTCETPKGGKLNPVYTATVLPGQTVYPTASPAGGPPDTHGIRLMEFTVTATKDNGPAPASGGTLTVTLERNADGVAGPCTSDKDEPAMVVTPGTKTVPFPAAPSGKYDICTQWADNSTPTKYWHGSTKAGVDLTDYSAPGSFTQDVKTTGPANGKC